METGGKTGAWDPQEDELLYYWQVRFRALERRLRNRRFFTLDCSPLIQTD